MPRSVHRVVFDHDASDDSAVPSGAIVTGIVRPAHREVVVQAYVFPVVGSRNGVIKGSHGVVTHQLTRGEQNRFQTVEQRGALSWSVEGTSPHLIFLTAHAVCRDVAETVRESGGSASAPVLAVPVVGGLYERVKPDSLSPIVRSHVPNNYYRKSIP